MSDNVFTIRTYSMNTKGLFDIILSQMKYGILKDNTEYIPWKTGIDVKTNEQTNEVCLIVDNNLTINYYDKKGKLKCANNPYVFLSESEIFKKYKNILNLIIRETIKLNIFKQVFSDYSEYEIAKFKKILCQLSKQ